MNISSSKPTLSSPIAGCMRWGKWGAGFSAMEYEALIKDCIANGITSFDHADIYGDYTTEEEFGRIVMNEPSLRQNIQLITKAGIQLVSENRPKHQIATVPGFDRSVAATRIVSPVFRQQHQVRRNERRPATGDRERHHFPRYCSGS